MKPFFAKSTSRKVNVPQQSPADHHAGILAEFPPLNTTPENLKLSNLLQYLRVASADPLIEALRPSEGIDLALGRFAGSILRILEEPDFTTIKRLLASALKERLTANEVFEFFQRVGICLPEIVALIRAFEETKPLSDKEREELAREFYPIALAFLERLGVKDPSDVAARVFVEVLNRYRRNRGHFKTLLFWVLRRRAASWFRSRAHRPVSEPLPENFDPPAPAPLPFADRDALDEALKQGWSLLSEIDQRLFWLHHVGDFSFPEMAAQSDFIGCRLNQTAMRSRVSRALSKLRPFLLPFRGVAHQELIEAIQRVASAAGSLSVHPPRPRSEARVARRQAAARSRCAKRRAGRDRK